MTRIEIVSKGEEIRIPSSWDEMTPAQVQAVFRLNDNAIREKWSLQEFKVRLLYTVLDIRPDAKRPTDLQVENVAMLCRECLGFVFGEDGRSIRFDSLRNFLPVAGRLHGPADLLQDITFGEFRHASMSERAFLDANQAEDLAEMIGVLYRRKTWKENRAGRRAGPPYGPAFRRDVAIASKLPTWQKNLILVWFCSCLHYLQTGKVSVNGEEIDLSLLFQDGGGKGPAFTWNDMVVQMAKDQVIGNMDRVDEEPLFSILSIMWSNYKESKRHEAIRKAH